MLNVLLIEDDLDLAATMIDYLELEGIRCDHASNGVAGLNLIERAHYDVILLDLNLPRLDGIGVCQRLREVGNDRPILMITARDGLEAMLDGFRAGTDDYLVKPFDLQELVVRMKALARRRSGQVLLLRCADLEMNLSERSVRRAGRSLRLSPIGWRLLEALMRASPGIISRPALESALWGDNIPDSNSLKVHLHHVRQAVDAPFEVALIHTLPGHGIALRDPE
ncbi:response regulator transcription factor [Billgrantia montanilacus]|uniref:DNA-binding response regulator n=1 Tax=Billgrantia montanilacus TaxID=2282305 RepID=A0A368U136_9GAMM|nr:response regulator transcription factor [Halomonas montanilacus]RCV88813.1 DNA-binding response regulator [Halomonas montanilacus]